MSTKRKYTEEGNSAVHPSRLAQVPLQQKSSIKRARKENSGPSLPRKQAHASSVNAIKTNIRNVKRRLQRSDDLPADVKAEDERALVVYEQELKAAEDEKIRQAMIKKYHMVRFFERQKATRLIKKIRKALITADDTAEVDRLKKELHVADVDYHYTQYSPLNEIYISIYRHDDKVGDTTEIVRPEMWHEVERRMESGRLHELRNGNRGVSVPVKERRPAKPTGANAEAPSQNSKSKKTLESSNQDLDEKQAIKQRPMSRRMTDEEFYKLNRRQKREELKRSGGFVPAKQKVEPVKAEEDGGNISDGGFFE